MRHQRPRTTPRSKIPGTVNQLPSGRWRARVLDPVTRRQVSLGTYETADDAWAALADHDVETRHASPAVRARQSSTLTVRELFALWLTVSAPGARTARRYRLMFDKHVDPVLGGHRVVTLTATDCQLWYARCSPSKTQARSAAYRMLATVLRYAVSLDLLDKSPLYVKGASRVPAVKRPPRVITAAEFDALVDALPERYRLLVVLARETGLRKGELLALTRHDVDLRARVLTVEKSWDYDTRSMTLGKTLAAGRVVGLGNAYAATRDHLLAMTDKDPGAFLFASRSNPDQPVNASSLHRPLVAAFAAIGRPDLTFHQLRHAYGVDLHQAGIPLHDAMTVMGHADLTTHMRYQRSILDPTVVAARVADYRSSLAASSG